MNTIQDIIFHTEGTSTDTRNYDQIKPDYFGIDERSLGDILRFAEAYSKKLVYFNSQNKIDGDWSPFVENNLAFVLAAISCENLHRYNDNFQNCIQHISKESIEKEKLKNIKPLLELTFDLFSKINNWNRLARHDLIHIDENRLVLHLKNAIKTKLAFHFRDFRSIIDNLNNDFNHNLGIDFSYQAFNIEWEKFENESSTSLKGYKLDLNQIIREITRIFKTVFSVTTHIKGLANELLDDSLENYPYHGPHISLLISFVKVFDYTKQDANGLTKRHLDYYYENILKQTLQSADPDQVHLFLSPAEHVIKSIIPSGTLLTAGVDNDGLAYTYATDFDLVLNQGKIVAIKNIHVAKNPLIGVGDKFASVSNIYSRNVNIDTNGFILNKNNNPASFDTFGKDQVDISWLDRDMEQAKIGFAISSPILMLKEGQRSISIKYTFNLNSLSSLISFIEELTNKEGLSPENAFYKLLNNIFSLRYTTEIGWSQVENYEILPPLTWTSGEIRVELMLDVSAPSMVCYNNEIHGQEYSSKWPVLEFVLSSEHAMYGYSYLKDLLIEQCEINVDVKKVKDLQIFNDLGKIDSTKPFYPFGSTPDLGSYFLIGNEELISKNISNFALDIQWHNLPRVKGGFKSYYKDYPYQLETDSFKVGITYLSEFRFHPIDESIIQKVNLFEDDNKEKIVKPETRFENLQLDKLEMIPNFTNYELIEYTNKTRTGFFKIEIMEPELGFGSSEYAKLFANAVIENSKSSGILSKESKKIELPNEPYAPQIRSIAINYSANARLIMNVNKVAENDKYSNEQVYHIHPFGNKIVFAHGLPQSNFLLPQFDDQGYLILGFDKINAPIELSIYFELEDNIQNEINNTKIPSTKWKYLVDDEWINFEENEVIFDGTNNFTTTGIVRLKVPSNINKNHRILSDNKYWISVSTAYNAEILSKTILIQTNGVSATWKPRQIGEQWQKNIPAKTISGFLDTRSDVNSVNQPFSSFGGRNLETTRNFYTRVSERLKHKNRAVTPEDYEKIILNRFPNLHQVKCINHFSHPKFVSKGWVKLIVVPKLEQSVNFYAPKVNYNQLKQIHDFIEQTSSPYTSIEVINPSYEKVKVSLKVVMKNFSNAGEYVKQLENDLIKFICPWFGYSQGQMNFGGKIERDDILSYIEGLEYVKFVTKLSVIVLHLVDGKYGISDSATNEGKNNELTSSLPWSVLIPSEHHEVELLEKPSYVVAKEKSIDTMKIGDDFIIINEKNDEIEFPYFDINKDTYYAIEIDI